MAKTDFNSVDEYIASQPEAVQGVLQHVRSAVRETVPSAEEAISYQIPTYKLQRSHLISKGNIRFPLSQAVPVKLIERIAKFRAKEVAERERPKAASPKKR